MHKTAVLELVNQTKVYYELDKYVIIVKKTLQKKKCGNRGSPKIATTNKKHQTVCVTEVFVEKYGQNMKKQFITTYKIFN